jgi:hypothetical protein
MTRHSPEKYSDVLESLHGLLTNSEEEVEDLSIAKIKEDLQKEGIDVDQMISDVNLMISKKLAGRRLEAAKEKRHRLGGLKEIKKYIDGKVNVKEAVLEILNGLTQSQPKLASVYFRKLEEANEEDMASILEDLMILESDDDVFE